jgi:hypothetical protein
MDHLKTSFAIGIAVVGMGCASATLPTDQVASAEASVRAAKELGASSVPRAELHMRLAQEELKQAKMSADGGDGERGKMLLERARVDAELAIALARQTKAEQNLEANSKSEVSVPDPAVRAAR